MRFRKSFKQNEVSICTNVVKSSRVCYAALLRKVGGEIAVGFVEHNQYVIRNLCHKSVYLVRVCKRARGIVWIGDEHNSRVRIDGFGNGVEIVRIIAGGDFDELALGNLSGQLVHNER